MSYRVGSVQEIPLEKHYGARGFNILDQQNRPLVTIGYETEAEAVAAHKLVADALKNTKLVAAHGG